MGLMGYPPTQYKHVNPVTTTTVQPCQHQVLAQFLQNYSGRPPSGAATAAGLLAIEDVAATDHAAVAAPLSKPKWCGALAKAAAAVGTGSIATHPLPLPADEEAAAQGDADGGDGGGAADAADAVVEAMAAAATGKAKAKVKATAKANAAGKAAALKRPAAAPSSVNKKPASAPKLVKAKVKAKANAAGKAAAPKRPAAAPKLVKAKGGWHTQQYIRGDGNSDHGSTYTMWVEPSGKRHRSRASADAAGFVG